MSEESLWERLKKRLDWTDIGFSAQEESQFNSKAQPIFRGLTPVVLVDPTTDPMDIVAPPGSSVASDVSDRAARRVGRVDMVPDSPATWTQLRYSASDVGPHADTNRATRTIPTGSIGWLTSIDLHFHRATAPTTAGRAGLTVQNNGNVGNSCSLFHITSTVGGAEHINKGWGALLSSGAVVNLRSQDLSSGGTYYYEAELVVTDYVDGF